MAGPTTARPSPSFLYDVAGLVLSADRELPGFARSVSGDRPDISVRGVAPAQWSTTADIVHEGPPADDGRPNVRIARGAEGYTFVYADDTRFWVDGPGTSIWFTWSSTLEDACTYLSGPVLSLALRLRGDLALHASGVVIGGRALVLAGPHGAGKSTTAAVLGRHGHHVLADDVVRLTRDRDVWLAHPYTSMLRLWPDAGHDVLGPGADLPRITSSWEKRALLPGAHRVDWIDEAAPVGAVLMLAGSAGDGYSVEPRALSSAKALVRLAANSSASHLLDADRRAREFTQLSSFVRDVRCAEIGAPPSARPRDTLAAAVLNWEARGA